VRRRDGGGASTGAPLLPHAIMRRGDGKGRGAPDIRPECEFVDTVSTKPERSAQPLSASVPSGGPVQALPGPEPSVSGKSRRSRRTSHSRLRHIPLPSTTPTAGGSGQQPDPRTVRVSPSNLSPLDRPPSPQMVAGHAPFPRDEVDRDYDRFSGRGRKREDAHPIPSPRGRGRAPSKAWEGEGFHPFRTGQALTSN